MSRNKLVVKLESDRKLGKTVAEMWVLAANKTENLAEELDVSRVVDSKGCSMRSDEKNRNILVVAVLMLMEN